MRWESVLGVGGCQSIFVNDLEGSEGASASAKTGTLAFQIARRSTFETTQTAAQIGVSLFYGFYCAKTRARFAI